MKKKPNREQRAVRSTALGELEVGPPYMQEEVPVW